VASSWFLFFSYHNDARPNKHQNLKLYQHFGLVIFIPTSSLKVPAIFLDKSLYHVN